MDIIHEHGNEQQQQCYEIKKHCPFAECTPLHLIVPNKHEQKVKCLVNVSIVPSESSEKINYTWYTGLGTHVKHITKRRCGPEG
jgi:hypothetical protein